MSQPNQLRSGVVLSYVNLAVTCVIPFLYTPIMLRMLGQNEYGLYGLAASVMEYLSLLSFGLGSTVIRYLSLYRAKNDKLGEERALGLFFAIYCVVGALLLVCAWIVSCNVEAIFHRGLTPAEIDKIRILIRILAVNMAITFPMSVFSSAIVAHERYVYRQAVGIFGTILCPIGNLVALYLGYLSVGMAIAGLIVQCILYPFWLVYFYRNLKLRLRFAHMPGGLVREMLGFSAFVFLSSLVEVLFWSTDKVILGMEASTAAIAVYNVSTTFNGLYTSLSNTITSVLQPQVTMMIADNAPPEDLTSIFILVGRLQYIVVSLVLTGFVVFGRQFLSLWAGTEYIESYGIALVTMIPSMIPLIQGAGVAIVTAQNKHRFRSLTYLGIAILNVAATYLLVPSMGAFGAALCSGVSYILGHGILMNVYYAKVTRLNIPKFWKNIAQMSPVPAAMLVLGLLASRWVAFDRGWIAFFGGVIVYTAIFGAGMYFLSFNDYEKGVVASVLTKLHLRKSA